MNEHDDEVTTDVDPAWIAAIRSDTATAPAADAGPGAAADAGNESEPTDSVGGEDWFDTELKWDAEATVGVSSGLIDRIRSEIDSTRGEGEPLLPPPSVVPRPPTPAPVPSSVPVTAVDAAASTTVRWEPRQRLSMTAPVKESAAIVDTSRHTGLDRTKVAIAVIIAVTLLIVVWLVSRPGGSDDPAPTGTVPTVSTPNTAASTEGSGGGG